MGGPPAGSGALDPVRRLGTRLEFGDGLLDLREICHRRAQLGAIQQRRDFNARVGTRDGTDRLRRFDDDPGFQNEDLEFACSDPQYGLPSLCEYLPRASGAFQRMSTSG